MIVILRNVKPKKVVILDNKESFGAHTMLITNFPTSIIYHEWANRSSIWIYSEAGWL